MLKAYNEYSLYKYNTINIHPLKQENITFFLILEKTARYAGFLLPLAEGFDLWPRLFFALWAQDELFMLFLAYSLALALAYFFWVV